jgi:hypothetical protein
VYAEHGYIKHLAVEKERVNQSLLITKRKHKVDDGRPSCKYAATFSQM